MPTNRTYGGRGGRRYPETIVRLLAGAPIEESEESRQRLIECGFFGDWPDLTPEIRQAALDVLAAWRAAKGRTLP